MKKLFVFIGIALITNILIGQFIHPTWQSQPPADTNKKYYTLTGFRHGVNFFQRVKLSQVEYEAGDSLTFKKYHSADVVYTWLKRWAEKYSDLVDLYEVGRSYEGRPILQITVTNKKTGKDTEKPGAFFEGGRHSGEVT